MRHEDHTHSSISGRAAAFRAWLAKRRADLWRVRAGRLVLVLAVAVLTTGAAAALLYAVSVTGGMSGVDVSAVPQMKETTRVYDRNGTVIYEFYEKKRTVVPLARMSPRVLHAIISIEDRNFYRHSGFDVKAIARAALANLESRKITQGASTITQQLARNTFLTQERSYKRKLQELRLALKIEHTYTKEQILEFYANRVYLGSGFYGVEAASQGYFGKPAAELSLGEAALLAGVVRSPVNFSPHRDLKKALKRRDAVLDAMARCGYITAAEAEQAERVIPAVRPRSDELANSSYAIDYIRKQMLNRFGYEATFNGGLRVYTSIDPRMQAAAESALAAQLAKLDKQRSYLTKRATEPTAHPELQGALLSLDVATGEIYALVGGRDYSVSKFDRAVDAKRQPGSTFKPIVYAAALEAGMTPATLVDASESAYETLEGTYIPTNDGREEFGRMSLRRALRNSVNTAAIRVGQSLGIPNILRCAQEFGMGKLPEVVSLPLGAGEVTLLELVRAYTAFPNGGNVTLPHIIMRVDSADGHPMLVARPEQRRAISEQTAFLMTSMLSDVVDRGTAYSVRSAGYAGPVAGKTGTTNEYRDAWFVGFTPKVVTGVWVGYDTPQPISNSGYGATVALPVWIRFMKAAFPKPAAPSFTKPDGIVQREVCAATGELATPYCRSQPPTYSEETGEPVPGTYMEYFSGRNLPRACEIHSSLASVAAGTEDLDHADTGRP